MEMTENGNKKEYASKGVGGTALGLAIAGTALGLLNGGTNLFGMGRTNTPPGPVDFPLWREVADNRYEAQGKLDGYALMQANQRFNDAQFVNGQFFGLYKDMRDRDDKLQMEICNLKTQVAVMSAVTPLQVNGVAAGAAAANELEATRRKYSDALIVNYVNGEFAPLEIASITTGDTATPKQNYNPLFGF